MHIHPLRPTPLVHGPVVADPRRRRLDRRVQPWWSAHRDAGLARRESQSVPDQVVDGGPAGVEEGGEGRGDAAGVGGLLVAVVVVVVVVAAGVWGWDFGCDCWDGDSRGFFIEGGGVW